MASPWPARRVASGRSVHLFSSGTDTVLWRNDDIRGSLLQTLTTLTRIPVLQEHMLNSFNRARFPYFPATKSARAFCTSAATLTAILLLMFFGTRDRPTAGTFKRDFGLAQNAKRGHRIRFSKGSAALSGATVLIFCTGIFYSLQTSFDARRDFRLVGVYKIL
jgi:hypothetical protein